MSRDFEELEKTLSPEAQARVQRKYERLKSELQTDLDPLSRNPQEQSFPKEEP